MAQRPDRIERIGKAAPIGGARHELRDALRSGAAYRPRVEAALLPDDAGEEFDRKLILRRILFERAADVFGGRRLRGSWSFRRILVAKDRFCVAGAVACGCAPVCAADTARMNTIESPANRIMPCNVPNRI